MQENFSSLSEVSPPKKNKRSWPVYLSAGFGLLFLGLAFLPEHSKQREALEERSTEQKELTLSENLAFIEQMKKEERVIPANKGTPTKPRLSKEIQARMNAPTTFFNTTQATKTAAQALGARSNKVLGGDTADTQLINQQQDITVVRVTRLAHPAQTIPAGEMISATLETAINPELPGMVRAITTRNSYSLVGQHLLIPKGSQLLGQFNSLRTEGQTRIFIVWNRVSLANGIRVSLNSPSTDAIGRAGQGADYINRHFFERFSMSALQSILGGTLANSGINEAEDNSRSQYRMGLASNLQQASNQSLQINSNIPTNLQTNQGAAINVFVAHDLDFYAVSSHES